MPSSQYVQTKSHLKEFDRVLRRATMVGLTRAAIYLHAECRKAVNVANTGERRRRTRSTVAGEKDSTYTVYEKPSRPGEPPHKITGTGQSNVIYESNNNTKNPATRVGVKKGGIHLAYLELGTRTIEARPWLVDTMIKHFRQIGMLAATGGKDRIK